VGRKFRFVTSKISDLYSFRYSSAFHPVRDFDLIEIDSMAISGEVVQQLKSDFAYKFFS
jgi:hypothetical protein